MGLDMYLRAEIYVDEFGDGAKAEYDAVVAAMGFDGVIDEGSRFFRVIPTVIYWRKANAVHGWFVDTLANGVDECQRIDVSREQLAQLRGACQIVIDAPKRTPEREALAKEHGLMPREGFFFGGVAMDDWYLEDLRHTVAAIDKVLASDRLKRADLYYQASW